MHFFVLTFQTFGTALEGGCCLVVMLFSVPKLKASLLQNSQHSNDTAGFDTRRWLDILYTTSQIELIFCVICDYLSQLHVHEFAVAL